MLLSVVLTALVTSQTVVLDQNDPAKDDRGPGSYVYPTRGAYPEGVFDLRRVRVVDEGTDVRFEITFARPIEYPEEQPRRTRAIDIPLRNDIYVKHIDIYVRTHDGPGRTDALPGRRVRFRPEDGWHRAVVITPQPFLLKSLLRDWDGTPYLVIPRNVSSTGRKVTARIPKTALSDTNPQSWGYAVMVFGALWENRFDFYEEDSRNFVPNALTMHVVAVPDFRRFGGGPMTAYHPNAIDLLAPTAEAQYRMLSSSDPQARWFATIELMYP